VLEELSGAQAEMPAAGPTWTTTDSRDALVANLGRAFSRGMGSRTKLSVAIARAMDELSESGLDPEVSSKFPLEKLTVKKSAKGNLGMYYVSEKKINVDLSKPFYSHPGGTSGTVVHEFGHHVDYSLRGPGLENIGYDAEAFYTGRDELEQDYENARAMARKIIGIDPYENYQQFGRAADSSVKIAKLCPRSYALLNDREWFAESFREYASGGALREKLKKRAPKTYEHIRKIFDGEYRK
jgi:hypothetical protein